MFSAIKLKGKKMYELAREGKSVELPPRPVSITSFCVSRDSADPQLVNFEVACSKGTYIRSLAFDFGKKLGSLAYLRSLRREAIGDYNVKNAWNMDELMTELTRVKAEGMAAKQAAAAAAEEAAASAAAAAAEEAALGAVEELAAVQVAAGAAVAAGKRAEAAAAIGSEGVGVRPLIEGRD